MIPAFLPKRLQSLFKLCCELNLCGHHQSKGCLLFVAVATEHRKYLRFCLGRTNVQISLPSIQVDECTKSAYQTPEGHSGSSQMSGHSPWDIPGRYACPYPGLSGSD